MTIECYRNNMLQKAFMAGKEGGGGEGGGGEAITKTRHRQVNLPKHFSVHDTLT